MLEIMTKERMKKSGDTKRHPVEVDQCVEQNSGNPGSADDEAHTCETKWADG